MTITELINELQRIRVTHGDIPVVTDEYNGGDNVLRDAKCEVRTLDWRAEPVVIIGGGFTF